MNEYDIMLMGRCAYGTSYLTPVKLKYFFFKNS